MWIGPLLMSVNSSAQLWQSTNRWGFYVYDSDNDATLIQTPLTPLPLSGIRHAGSGRIRAQPSFRHLEPTRMNDTLQIENTLIAALEAPNRTTPCKRSSSDIACTTLQTFQNCAHIRPTS